MDNVISMFLYFSHHIYLFVFASMLIYLWSSFSTKGGREFVFQTGPDQPWIIDTYASAAKYPYASIVAQEIFQSGIIPSDTDFRVFVDYGNLVGM